MEEVGLAPGDAVGQFDGRQRRGGRDAADGRVGVRRRTGAEEGHVLVIRRALVGRVQHGERAPFEPHHFSAPRFQQRPVIGRDSAWDVQLGRHARQRQLPAGQREHAARVLDGIGVGGAKHDDRLASFAGPNRQTQVRYLQGAIFPRAVEPQLDDVAVAGRGARGGQRGKLLVPLRSLGDDQQAGAFWRRLDGRRGLVGRRGQAGRPGRRQPTPAGRKSEPRRAGLFGNSAIGRIPAVLWPRRPACGTAALRLSRLILHGRGRRRCVLLAACRSRTRGRHRCAPKPLAATRAAVSANAPPPRPTAAAVARRAGRRRPRTGPTTPRCTPTRPPARSTASAAEGRKRKALAAPAKSGSSDSSAADPSARPAAAGRQPDRPDWRSDAAGLSPSSSAAPGSTLRAAPGETAGCRAAGRLGAGAVSAAPSPRETAADRPA